MTGNTYKDCLDVAKLREWSSAYIGNTTEDNYTTPLLADANWWASLKVDRLYVMAGGDEVFADDIASFADRLKVSIPISPNARNSMGSITCNSQIGLHNVEFFSSPGEAHDSPVLDFMLNAPEGPATLMFYEWSIQTAR